MIKLLVTTDLSENSKAGLLYANQLATQQNCELIFFHVHNISIPSLYSVLRKGEFEKEQETKIRQELISFVAETYNGLSISQTKSKYVIQSSAMPQSAIMEYAAAKKCNYICLSTRGGGKLKRLLGTNATNLINFSPVPVIAVPYNYKTTTIDTVLYASDFVNLQIELKKVVAFAKPIHARVELLHFIAPLEAAIDSTKIAAALKRSSRYEIKLHIKSRDPLESLVSDINSAIKVSKPSLLIMFTEQNRELFQRIFLPSKSAQYSFNGKVPILVFHKSK